MLFALVTDSATVVAAQARWLAWTDTETVTLDRDGHELARAPGVRIPVRDVEYQLETVTRRQSLPSCAEIDGVYDDATEPGTSEITSLALVAGSRRIELPAPPAPPPGTNEYGFHAALVGSVGSVVFVRMDEYEFGCGAHGSSSVTVQAIDVATGRTLDLRPLDEDALRTEALQAFGVDPESDELPAREEIHWEAAQPVFIEGRLSLRHAMVAPACYACSSSDWSSYSAMRWVVGRSVPAALQLDPPEPVRAWLAQHDVHGLAPLP